MANGSPFVWFERTQGTAASDALGRDLDDAGSLRVWYNQNGVIGVTITSAYILQRSAERTSVASYNIIADSRSWSARQARGSRCFKMPGLPD